MSPSKSKIEFYLSEKEKALFKIKCKALGKTQAQLLREYIRSIIPSEQPDIEKGIENKTNVISFRLTDSECQKIDQRFALENFDNRGSWVKNVIRYTLKKEPVLTKTEVNILREANRELAAIGRNLNQVAHAINIDHKNSAKMTPKLFEQLVNNVKQHRQYIIQHFGHFIE